MCIRDSAAAKAGFDEIMFDYVRFPSDGDVDGAVYSNRPAGMRKNDAAPAFVRYASNRLGLADPGASPGATVARALRRFNRALEGRDALLLPWVQDFSFTIPYGVDEVRAQIYSARLAGAKGYLIWNASGVYTEGTLTPP